MSSLLSCYSTVDVRLMYAQHCSTQQSTPGIFHQIQPHLIRRYGAIVIDYILGDVVCHKIVTTQNPSCKPVWHIGQYRFKFKAICPKQAVQIIINPD